MGSVMGIQGCVTDRRAARGFTLIELMVVVAVVAILAAIALPSYQDALRKSRRGQAKADLVELAQIAERHRTVQGSYATWAPPFTTSPKSGTSHYDIALIRTASAFTLTATPSAGQANDSCGTLAINQAGQRWHSAGTDEQCQFGTTGSPPDLPADPAPGP